MEKAWKLLRLSAQSLQAVELLENRVGQNDLFRCASSKTMIGLCSDLAQQSLLLRKIVSNVPAPSEKSDEHK
jgi:hypothetical protein